MSKKSDTWMPFYVTDYLGDTMHLSTQQHGAYLLLLLACWKAGGELPDDDDQLVSITRLTAGEWRKSSTVLRRFFAAGDGVLSHGRVKLELEKAKALSEKRSVIGKTGGRPPKAKQTETNRFPEAEAKAKQTETPSPSPSHISKELTPSLSTAVQGVQPTDAGLICKAMKAVGIADVNPGHQTLRTLLEAGADEAEFVGAAIKAVAEQKGFAYALGIVTNERKRAAQLADQIHRGALPVAETAYQRSMRERMQEAAPEAARKDPSHAAHAADFFNAIEVPTRTVERIR